MVFTFSPFVHLENWLLSAVQKVPVKKPGIQFNVIVLLCCGGGAAKSHCKGIQELQMFLRWKGLSRFLRLQSMVRPVCAVVVQQMCRWTPSEDKEKLSGVLKTQVGCLLARIPPLWYIDYIAAFSPATLLKLSKVNTGAWKAKKNVPFQFVPHVFFLSLAKESRNLLFGVNCPMSSLLCCLCSSLRLLWSFNLDCSKWSCCERHLFSHQPAPLVLPFSLTPPRIIALQ